MPALSHGPPMVPIDAYYCSCAAGYQGHNCDIDVDECASSPCVIGAVCTESASRMSGNASVPADAYICSCAAGYQGRICDIDVDECASSPCVNGAVCTESANATHGSSSSGSWHAASVVSSGSWSVGAMPALSHGPPMVPIDAYYCSCAAGYQGHNCDIDVDECASSPCVNGAVCTESASHMSGNASVPVDAYICSCAAGYQGRICDIDVDECASSPCVNGAVCTESGSASMMGGSPSASAQNGSAAGVPTVSHMSGNVSVPSVHSNVYYCSCSAGYQGHNCDIDVDECASSPCVNGAVCTESGGASSIGGSTFAPAQNGSAAGVPTVSHMSGNVSVPSVPADAYICSCAAGYQGRICDIDVDECASSPCVNGAVCTESANATHGSSSSGSWHAASAVSSGSWSVGAMPALSHGPPMVPIDAYYCSCAAGYQGHNCDIDVDECASSPCVNGAVCTESGYVARRSSASGSWDDSSSSSWQSSMSSSGSWRAAGSTGSVKPRPHFQPPPVPVNAYYCACVVGYHGDNCNMDVDECASTPCLNAGVCTDSNETGTTASVLYRYPVPLNAYRCDCQPGYAGGVCAPGHLLEYSSRCSVMDSFQNANSSCNIDVDECASSPCPAHTSCTDSLDNITIPVNTFQCTCDDGWFDTNNDLAYGVWSDGCEAGCPVLASATCDTCTDGFTCVSLTCQPNSFDINHNISDGCEAGCPSVLHATCDACPDPATCMAVTCAPNYFDVNLNASDGCEVGCPNVSAATCLTCSAADRCESLVCAANNFDVNQNASDGCETGCPNVTGAVCNMCSASDTCTNLTCQAYRFDVNGDATDGCEASCPNIPGGQCLTCSDENTCTSLVCNANRFDSNGIATDGCEIGCPGVFAGQCGTCATAQQCNTVSSCDPNHFDTNGDATDGCEAGCPNVGQALCVTCATSTTCTTLRCSPGWDDANQDPTDGCEAPQMCDGTNRLCGCTADFTVADASNGMLLCERCHTGYSKAADLTPFDQASSSPTSAAPTCIPNTCTSLPTNQTGYTIGNLTCNQTTTNQIICQNQPTCAAGYTGTPSDALHSCLIPAGSLTFGGCAWAFRCNGTNSNCVCLTDQAAVQRNGTTLDCVDCVAGYTRARDTSPRSTPAACVPKRCDGTTANCACPQGTAAEMTGSYLTCVACTNGFEHAADLVPSTSPSSCTVVQCDNSNAFCGCPMNRAVTGNSTNLACSSLTCAAGYTRAADTVPVRSPQPCTVRRCDGSNALCGCPANMYAIGNTTHLTCSPCPVGYERTADVAPQTTSSTCSVVQCDSTSNLCGCSANFAATQELVRGPIVLSCQACSAGYERPFADPVPVTVSQTCSVAQCNDTNSLCGCLANQSLIDTGSGNLSCASCPAGFERPADGFPLSSPSACAASNCAATQVINSDKAAAVSLMGVTADIVAVTCDPGFHGGGNWTCGNDGIFAGSSCVPNVCHLPVSQPGFNINNVTCASLATGNISCSVQPTCAAGYIGSPTNDDHSCMTDRSALTLGGCTAKLCSELQCPQGSALIDPTRPQGANASSCCASNCGTAFSGTCGIGTHLRLNQSTVVGATAAACCTADIADRCVGNTVVGCVDAVTGCAPWSPIPDVICDSGMHPKYNPHGNLTRATQQTSSANQANCCEVDIVNQCGGNTVSGVDGSVPTPADIVCGTGTTALPATTVGRTQQDCCYDTDGCREDTDCGSGRCGDIPAPGTGYVCTCSNGYTGDSVRNGPAACQPDPCITNPDIANINSASTFCAADPATGLGGIPSGSTCQFTCKPGYVPSGVATCRLGTYDVQTCEQIYDWQSVPTHFAACDDTCGTAEYTMYRNISCIGQGDLQVAPARLCTNPLPAASKMCPAKARNTACDDNNTNTMNDVCVDRESAGGCTLGNISTCSCAGKVQQTSSVNFDTLDVSSLSKMGRAEEVAFVQDMEQKLCDQMKGSGMTKLECNDVKLQKQTLLEWGMQAHRRLSLRVLQTSSGVSAGFLAATNPSAATAAAQAAAVSALSNLSAISVPQGSCMGVTGLNNNSACMAASTANATCSYTAANATHNATCVSLTSLSSGSASAQPFISYTWAKTTATCLSACGLNASTLADSYACRANGIPTLDQNCYTNDITRPISFTSCAATAACVTYSWYAQNFASCPSGCQNGDIAAIVLNRSVICLGSDNSIATNASACTGYQPSATQICPAVLCPTYQWVSTPWTPTPVCPNVTCDTPASTLTRTTSCHRTLGLAVSTVDPTWETLLCPPRPNVTATCAAAPRCRWNWTISLWHPQVCPPLLCDASTVIRNRSVVCRNQDGRSTPNFSLCPSPTPAATHRCVADVCRFRWHSTDWTPSQACPAGCGEVASNLTRVTTCQDQHGRLAANMTPSAAQMVNCSNVSAPSTLVTCNTSGACSSLYGWHNTSEWSPNSCPLNPRCGTSSSLLTRVRTCVNTSCTALANVGNVSTHCAADVSNCISIPGSTVHGHLGRWVQSTTCAATNACIFRLIISPFVPAACPSTCGMPPSNRTRNMTCLDQDGLVWAHRYCAHLGALNTTIACAASRPCPLYQWVGDSANSSWATCPTGCGHVNSSRTKVLSCVSTTGAVASAQQCVSDPGLDAPSSAVAGVQTEIFNEMIPGLGLLMKYRLTASCAQTVLCTCAGWAAGGGVCDVTRATLPNSTTCPYRSSATCQGGDCCGPPFSAPVACAGEWTQFGACSATCGNAVQTRQYMHLNSASNGGTPCPAADGAIDVRSCNLGPCSTANNSVANISLPTECTDSTGNPSRGQGNCSCQLSEIIALGGEQACEGHGYNATQCANVGCCSFNEGQCWSNVGQSPCQNFSLITGPTTSAAATSGTNTGNVSSGCVSCLMHTGGGSDFRTCLAVPAECSDGNGGYSLGQGQCSCHSRDLMEITLGGNQGSVAPSGISMGCSSCVTTAAFVLSESVVSATTVLQACFQRPAGCETGNSAMCSCSAYDVAVLNSASTQQQWSSLSTECSSCKMYAQVVHGIAASQISSTCAQVPCVGSWSAYTPCSTTCGDGTQQSTYTVITPAANSGTACSAASGATQVRVCNNGACPTPVGCVGTWSAFGTCSVTCGAGTRTRAYVISRPAADGGTACSVADGATQTQNCNAGLCSATTGPTVSVTATLELTGAISAVSFEAGVLAELPVGSTYTLTGFLQKATAQTQLPGSDQNYVSGSAHRQQFLNGLAQALSVPATAVQVLDGPAGQSTGRRAQQLPFPHLRVLHADAVAGLSQDATLNSGMSRRRLQSSTIDFEVASTDSDQSNSVASALVDGTTFSAALASSINNANGPIQTLSSNDIPPLATPTFTTKMNYTVSVPAERATTTSLLNSSARLATVADAAKVPNSPTITASAVTAAVSAVPAVPAPTPAPGPAGSDNDDDGWLSDYDDSELLIGAVLIVVCVLLLAGGVVFILVRRRRNAAAVEERADPSSMDPEAPASSQPRSETLNAPQADVASKPSSVPPEGRRQTLTAAMTEQRKRVLGPAISAARGADGSSRRVARSWSTDSTTAEARSATPAARALAAARSGGSGAGRARTPGRAPRSTTPGSRRSSDRSPGRRRSAASSAARQAAFDSLFRQYDRDRDGLLGRQEVAAMIQSIQKGRGGAASPQALDPAYLDGLMSSFARFDQHDGGTIDRAEFEKLWAHLSAQNRRQSKTPPRKREGQQRGQGAPRARQQGSARARQQRGQVESE
jgi:hypothetical protein